jgi:hypothetical protein
MAALVSLGPVAHAAPVTGTVRNGTSGKPASDVDVVLIQLQGEMQAIASTKTDSTGKYTIDNPAAGRDGMPMLVRAIYRGVNFHQPLPPGQTTVDLTVYEPTSDPKTITTTTRVVMFQPNGENLLVVEEYDLQNNSQPPVAFYLANGNFEFQVPEGAENPQASSWGPSRMPVNQGTINRGKGKYAIAYAFQPGENGVRVTYQLPYEGNQAIVKLVSAHNAERVGLIAPAGVQIASAGFTPQGQEQGFNFYAREAIPAGTPFEVSLSGTASPSAANIGQAGSAGGSAAIQVLPNRLDSLKWMFLGGFVLLFGLGVFSIWRRPAVAAAGAGVPDLPPDQGHSRAARKKQATVAAQQSVAVPPAAPATPTNAPDIRGAQVSTVERQVEQGLDSLKDKLFRLELRRQAGTLTDEEYLRERAQTERILRELVGR